MRAPARIVQPVPARCVASAGRCGRSRVDPYTGARREGRVAAFGLVGPDGEVVPGAWYCEIHASAVVAEFEAQGEDGWTLIPIVREAP